MFFCCLGLLLAAGLSLAAGLVYALLQSNRFLPMAFKSAEPGAASPTQTASPTASNLPVWLPPLDATWQWQLEGLPVDLSYDVVMYDIDLFDNDTSVVAALHDRGRKVVCYLSAGSWEDWRPDAELFPDEVIGKEYEGWPGENWLDIRRIDLLAPVMQARLDQCKAKGFDAVEPDNIDAYTNDTGFPLSYQDQLAYNIWLANEAHARGLSIGLKNDPDQVMDLLAYFDWALTEDCLADDWCDQVSPFVTAGKAVFMAEYTDTGMTLDRMCQQAALLHFNPILKHRELDAWREICD
ncbi:MAG: endo alpha-1,4 polygalactosaminidase [Chloroflexota bacterium]|nr:MAG: endo alpha-1,4 polygalactosaminidase [Chloroflexota bacterium]